ncbi:hypothetical protein BMF94_3943 [Rhodotorula taiwanensis]|uniref:FMN hydroxy acid dehydrogenase domain-containing protein n=1 Tax=Rhodotorula taiwanensis TaxID=741276 RepID=A0A2S5B872_9BASI|nr:hypothetical protein BMF94_3943 [Rhodotorula taiwanensis]
MNKDDLPPRTTPDYAKYQRDIFLEGAETGSLPEFNTDPDLVEEKAKETLSKGGWLYANSNAGVSWTHRANREAFYQWRIIPRMLVDTNQRDMSCTFKLGNQQYTFDAPIGFAPIGINKIYHPKGEFNSARVAGELNLCYALSTAGSQPISEVARVHDEGAAQGGRPNKHKNGAKGRWFQLYWPHNDDLTVSLLQDAHNSSYSACVLTLDTWQLAWRHGDIASANKWKEISGGKPFVLKGIQSVGDAKRAAATEGIDGIVVSNHAGRQVDGAIGSLDALADIVDAGVGDKLTIMFDSALALGAKFVFCGRPWVYGMSINGEAGVRHVMKALLADFDLLMNVGGFRNLGEITRDSIRHIPHASLGGAKL